MKLLRVLLLAAGVMCLCGLAGVVLPMRSFLALASNYGAGPGVDQPLFEYVFRLSSAVVGSCGVFYLVLAMNPRQHGALVPVGGGALLFVGAVLAGTGLWTGMPVAVFLIDFAGCALLGALILAAWWAWGRGGEDAAKTRDR